MRSLESKNGREVLPKIFIECTLFKGFKDFLKDVLLLAGSKLALQVYIIHFMRRVRI